MNQVAENIISELRRRGYRITDARTAIIDAFSTQTRPHSITDYIERVGVDEVTVYRTIELLLNEGLIERLSVRGETLFALADGHHHHLVCTDCGQIEHLPCQTPDLNLNEHPFARITEHEVTFYGVCKACAG